MQTSATVPAGRHAEAVAEPRVTTKRRPHYLNTRTFTSHICKFLSSIKLALFLTHASTVYGPYIYLPIICAFAWLAALLSLIGMWVKAGKPKYAVTEPHVVFISDVAGSHKVSRAATTTKCSLSSSRCAVLRVCEYFWQTVLRPASMSFPCLPRGGCDILAACQVIYAVASRSSVRSREGLRLTAAWIAIVFAAIGGTALILLSVVRYFCRFCS